MQRVVTRTCARASTSACGDVARRTTAAATNRTLKKTTRAARATSDDDDDDDADCPEWARDLRYDEATDEIYDGDGKPLGQLNEYGATRFDVAVRAIRGEYDVPSTENDVGEILETITQFPAKHVYQIAVLKEYADNEAFVEDIVRAVCGNVLKAESVEVKPRGAKFSSIWVTTWIHSARDVTEATDRVRANDKVKFVF